MKLAALVALFPYFNSKQWRRPIELNLDITASFHVNHYLNYFEGLSPYNIDIVYSYSCWTMDIMFINDFCEISIIFGYFPLLFYLLFDIFAYLPIFWASFSRFLIFCLTSICNNQSVWRSSFTYKNSKKFRLRRAMVQLVLNCF